MAPPLLCSNGQPRRLLLVKVKQSIMLAVFKSILFADMEHNKRRHCAPRKITECKRSGAARLLDPCFLPACLPACLSLHVRSCRGTCRFWWHAQYFSVAAARSRVNIFTPNRLGFPEISSQTGVVRRRSNFFFGVGWYFRRTWLARHVSVRYDTKCQCENETHAYLYARAGRYWCPWKKRVKRSQEDAVSSKAVFPPPPAVWSAYRPNYKFGELVQSLDHLLRTHTNMNR